MKSFTRLILIITAGIATILVLMWISTWKSVELSKVDFSSDLNDRHPIKLPFSDNFVGQYTISIDVENTSSTTQEFRIVPDDEVVAIRLNGQSVALDGIPQSDRRNYESGFLIRFENLKLSQTNLLQFDLINESNPTGFRIEATQRLSTSQFIAIGFVLFCFALFLSHSLKISHLQKILIIIGLIMSLIYLSKTDSRTRTFDVYEGGGHKDYIEYLIDKRRLPNPGEGWEYHQPPLYYLIAATSKLIGQIPKLANDLWAQLVALYFWTIFLVSGLACLNIAFKKRLIPLVISSIALCLWPSGIIHSIRIGNDLALYAFYTLSLFYTLRWWKTRASIHLFWAGIWMGASLLTKSNGLVMVATIASLFFIHTLHILKNRENFHTKKIKLIRDFSLLTLVFTTAFLLNFGDNIYYYLKGSSQDWLLSNVSQSINSGLKVRNNPENYLIFDSATYLLNPFISTWEDISGRQYFWNFLLRSSLSSEFSFQGNVMRYWGISNGIFLLISLGSIAILFLQKQPQQSLKNLSLSIYKQLPWVLTLVLPFFLLVAYRIKVPLSCNTDFRYIYPALINILFFAVLAWKKPKTYPIPAMLSLGLVLIATNSFLWMSFI